MLGLKSQEKHRQQIHPNEKAIKQTDADFVIVMLTDIVYDADNGKQYDSSQCHQRVTHQICG